MESLYNNHTLKLDSCHLTDTSWLFPYPEFVHLNGLAENKWNGNSLIAFTFIKIRKG